MAWQPIETAPRDGTVFLAETWKGVCRCRWKVVDWGVDYGHIVSCGWSNPDDAFWFEELGDNPQRWAPLPDQPVDTEALEPDY